MADATRVVDKVRKKPEQPNHDVWLLREVVARSQMTMEEQHQEGYDSTCGDGRCNTWRQRSNKAEDLNRDS